MLNSAGLQVQFAAGLQVQLAVGLQVQFAAVLQVQLAARLQVQLAAGLVSRKSPPIFDVCGDSGLSVVWFTFL